MLLTVDEQMRDLCRKAQSIAASRATVFITGESGTGKECLSRFIHLHSHRAQGRFVAINCAALPEGLLESELFGFEKGAFTGAVNSKPGKFELASGGTFLLDEISEMPLLLQAKLLRVIQEGEVERLGAQRPIKVDVRIIATSNRDIKAMIAQNQFREDLFYRLNVIPLKIPPLRERPDDTILLAREFLQRAARANNTEVKVLADDAVTKLISWNWPGNVRELENVMERAALLTQTASVVTAEDLHIADYSPKRSDRLLKAGMTVSDAERLLIIDTLNHTNQNRTHAARMLGISLRTLRNKLNEYRRDNLLPSENTYGESA